MCVCARARVNVHVCVCVCVCERVAGAAFLGALTWRKAPLVVLRVLAVPSPRVGFLRLLQVPASWVDCLTDRFGLVLVDTRLIKTQIRDAALALADAVMCLVEDDCRRVIRLVTSRYEALLAKCQEQPKVLRGMRRVLGVVVCRAACPPPRGLLKPVAAAACAGAPTPVLKCVCVRCLPCVSARVCCQDAEGLKSMRLFLQSCDGVVSQLDAVVTDTMSRLTSLGACFLCCVCVVPYVRRFRFPPFCVFTIVCVCGVCFCVGCALVVAGRFTRAVSFEDGRSLWEARRWPSTIASASADALAYLDLLLEQLSGGLLKEKAAFEAALATYPDKVRRMGVRVSA